MRRIFLSTLVALMSVCFWPASVLASFSPDRQTFQCVNEDCNAGPNFITFNSFTNSPVPDAPHNGDERFFFEAKDSSTSTSTQSGFGDNISVRNGERVMLRVYIHNDANPDLMGGEEATMARNLNINVQLPNSSNSANQVQAIAYITADNATPRQISDTVDLSGSGPFSLTFDRNSPVNMTVRANNGDGDFMTFQQTGVSFSDDRNMSVTFAGWPGGFKHHGMLTMIAVVRQTTVQPAFACTGLNAPSTTTTNTPVTFTANSNAQAAGANVTGYNFTVRDSNGSVIDTRNSQTNSYTFNQANPGTYTVSTVITSDRGNTSSSSCSQQITVTAPPATLSTSTSQPTTTTQPAKNPLPNTGAGSTIALFSVVSVVAGLGHYLWTRRLSF